MTTLSTWVAEARPQDVEADGLRAGPVPQTSTDGGAGPDAGLPAGASALGRSALHGCGSAPDFHRLPLHAGVPRTVARRGPTRQSGWRHTRLGRSPPRDGESDDVLDLEGRDERRHTGRARVRGAGILL